MSTIYAEIGRIRAEAARLDVVKTLLTLLGFPLVLVGYLLRWAWMAPAFLYASALWGWRKADAHVKAREREGRG